MEGFSSATGLLPEQVWDELDWPNIYMLSGRPTGSAMPLMWAHAECIKLLRSISDGRVFDLIPEVAERYLSGRNTRHRFDMRKYNRQVRRI
jgi:glucoamylase